MSRPCSAHDEMRNTFRILVGKPEGKRPQGKPMRIILKWKDNIGCCDGIHVSWDIL